jgi:hypothetical protein
VRARAGIREMYVDRARAHKEKYSAKSFDNRSAISHSCIEARRIAAHLWRYTRAIKCRCDPTWQKYRPAVAPPSTCAACTFLKRCLCHFCAHLACRKRPKTDCNFTHSRGRIAGALSWSADRGEQQLKTEPKLGAAELLRTISPCKSQPAHEARNGG